MAVPPVVQPGRPAVPLTVSRTEPLIAAAPPVSTGFVTVSGATSLFAARPENVTVNPASVGVVECGLGADREDARAARGGLGDNAGRADSRSSR